MSDGELLQQTFDMKFLLNAIPGAVVVYKFCGQKLELLFCSSGIEKMSGYTVDEFMARIRNNADSTVFAPDLKRFRSAIDQAVSTHSDIDFVYRAYCKDGTLSWIWFQGHITAGEDGAPLLEALLLDITRNTHMYQGILDEATAMITIIDAETYEILYANKAALEVTSEDYIGSICYEYINHSDAPCGHCMLPRAVPSSFESREVSYGSHTYNQLFKMIDWNGRSALMEYSEDITEQKQYIHLVEEQKDALTNIIGNIPTGIIVYQYHDGELTILNANPTISQMLGLDSSDILGASFERILTNTHAEDVAHVREAGKRLLTPEAKIQFEFRYRCALHDSHYIWLSANAHSVLQSNGAMNIYICYTDITEQKQAQLENQALSLQIQDIFDQIPSGICLYRYRNETLTPLVRNKGFWRVFGHTADYGNVFPGCVAFEKVHPDDLAQLKDLLAKSLHNHTRLSHIYRVFSDTLQQYLWIRIEASVVAQEDSALLYANYFNVTERIENEQMTESIIRSMSGGFAVYRIGKTIETLMFTDGIPRMQGYTREEYAKAIAHNALDVIYETDLPKLMEALTSAIADNAPLHISYRIYCKDHSLIWVNLSAYPAELSTPSQPVYYAVFTNVSEQFGLYQNVIENTENGIMVVDHETQEIYYANDVALQVTGNNWSTYIDRKCYELLGHTQICDNCLLPGENQHDILQISINNKILQIKSHPITWMGRSASVQYLTDITSEQAYQNLLEQEKERYRLIVEKSGIALMDYDNLTGNTFVNEAFSHYAFSHISPKLLVANECDISIVHPDDVPLLYQFFQESQDGRASNQVKLRMKMTDNTYRWTVMIGLYFYDDDGNPLREIATFQDVDDVTTQYEELKNRYEYETAQRGFHEKDVIETVVYNISKKQIMNYQSSYMKPDELSANGHRIHLGKLSDDLGTQQKIRNFIDPVHLTENFHQGIHPSIEYQRKLPDSGEKLWVRADARIVREPQTGDLIAFIYTYNIDRTKNMELISHKLIMTNYEIALLISSHTEKIKYTIGHTERFSSPSTGENYRDVLERFLHQVGQPDELSRLQSILSLETAREKLTRNSIYSQNISVTVSNRFLRLRWNIFYFDEKQDYLLITLSDITDVYLEEQKRSQELRTALEEAKVAAKAKTDFLSRMSHDMRTPMNGILGLTNLLQGRTDPQDIQEDVEQIKLSGKYLLNLINDTLDMSKIDSGKLQLHPVPLNGAEVIGNLIANAQITAKEKGVIMDYDLPDIPPDKWIPVLADAARLEQVFMNIVSNAIKFTPKGGVVQLHMHNISVTDDAVTDYYAIRDTGIGMTEEFLQHIYEPFSQEGRIHTERENGTGLGLAIVKQLIDLMDGQIKINSHPNEGTEVIIILNYPRYHGKLEPSEIPSVNLDILDGKHILLCEDHPLNAQIASRLLTQKNISVEHAANGQEGVQLFKTSSSGYFDAILMDIRMPVMDGLEASRKIRALSHPDARKIPIIAMTANAFEDDIQQCMEAGMTAHLAKPVNPSKLYETLAKQLSK